MYFSLCYFFYIVTDMQDPLLEYNNMVKRELLPPMRRRSIAPFFDSRYSNKIFNTKSLL